MGKFKKNLDKSTFGKKSKNKNLKKIRKPFNRVVFLF